MTRRKILLACGYLALLTLMVLGIWKATMSKKPIRPNTKATKIPTVGIPPGSRLAAFIRPVPTMPPPSATVSGQNEQIDTQHLHN